MPADSKNLFKPVLDGFPSAVFIVKKDAVVVDCNAAAAAMLGRNPGLILKSPAGEVLNCVHSEETPEGCGHSPACADCLLRLIIARAINGCGCVRQGVTIETRDRHGLSKSLFLLSASPLPMEKEQLVMLVLEEVGAIANLRAVMPICSGCKNVRDDRGRWLGVERYFRTHLDIHFSHGLCPECAQAFFPKDHHVNDPHEPAAEKTQPDSLQ